MNLLSWISTAIAHAVTQGIRKGLEDAGIDPDSKDANNPLAAAKAHALADEDDVPVETNGKRSRARA